MESSQIFNFSENVSQGQKEKIMEHFLQDSNAQDLSNVMQFQPRFFFFQVLPHIKAINVYKFRIRDMQQIRKKFRKIKYWQQFISVPILQQISHIDLSKLLNLQLDNTSITSIQPLTYLQLKQLQYISMKNNRITCLKPMQKVCFRDFVYFDLRENMFEDVELGWLQKLFQSKHVNWVRLLDDNYGIYHRMRVAFFKVNLRKIRIDELDWMRRKEDEKLMTVMKHKLKQLNR